jgi:hypothetical protein
LPVILRVFAEDDAMDDGKRALWTKTVADFELSGLSQREFAEQKKLELSNLRYWIYRLRNDSRPLATEKSDPPAAAERAERRAPGASPGGGSRLVPVRVGGSAAPKARREGEGDGLLELALPSGARLRFPTGTDLKYLRELASAL